MENLILLGSILPVALAQLEEE